MASRILSKVLSLSRRGAAVLIVLALAVGSPAVCAGWMPTPEDRMACCTGEGTCPMHAAETARHDSEHALSQADADRCCAASERDDSAPAPLNLTLAAAAPLAVDPIPIVMPDISARGDLWRTSVPIPATRIPRHLLFSVLLV
jgi:Tfp pilus assembly protein PilX